MGCSGAFLYSLKEGMEPVGSKKHADLAMSALEMDEVVADSNAKARLLHLVLVLYTHRAGSLGHPSRLRAFRS